MKTTVLLLTTVAAFLVFAQEYNWKRLRLFGPLEIIDLPKLWNIYKKTHNKTYCLDYEDDMHLEIFTEALKSFIDKNRRAIANSKMLRWSIDNNSDWTDEEYIAQFDSE